MQQKEIVKKNVKITLGRIKDRKKKLKTLNDISSRFSKKEAKTISLVS